MRILVACEESQIVCMAFRKRGHEAYSCDIQDCSGGHPEWHIKDDVLKHLDDGWDMMIAFPPCTHLCSSGAQYWGEKQRDNRQQKAIVFFMRLLGADIPKIAIENPAGIMSSVFRKPDQYIHPFMFGDPYLKRTGLWLKHLNKIIPTNIVTPLAHWHGGCRRGGATKDGTRTPCKLPTALMYGEKARSKTFQGIADAMAEQWG